MNNCPRAITMLGWLVAGILLVAPCAAQQYHLRAPDEVIPRTLFGLHIHRVALTTPWPDAPFGSLRLWDAGVTWWDMQRIDKTKYEFRLADKTVSLAESHQVEPFMTLGMTATWAASRPNDSAKFRPGSVSEPRNMQDWRDFVQTLATRYKGRIHYWEVWNEPNDGAFYTGTIPNLVQISKVAYETLKQVDPSNMVSSPPPTYGLKGVPWLNDYLRAGGGKYADIIGYHMYVDKPEDIVPLAEKIHEVMNENGVGDKPLWNTETGWGLQDKLAPLQAEGYVPRAYILSWASGVTRFYWYDWDSNTEGLAKDNGKTRTSAGFSFVEVQKWLVGARMLGCDSDSPSMWTCQITRDGGYHGYIVWDPDGPKKFSIPAAWKVVFQRDIDSNTHDLRKETSTEIGIRPILLENKTP
jgi:hypothetical protein